MNATSQSSLLAALDELEQRRSSDSSESKRSFQRFSIRGEADMRAVHGTKVDSAPVRIHLRDVCRAGIGFLVEQRLEPDTRWRIVFETRGYPVVSQSIIVRHTSEVTPGIYLVGGQFCIDDGLMVLLGVDPARLDEGAQDDVDELSAMFMAPTDVDSPDE